MRVATTLMILILTAVLASFTIMGCTSFNGEDGAPGADGKAGPAGMDGATGDLPLPCTGCVNITSTDIADGSITTQQLGTGVVTEDNILDRAITNVKIDKYTIENDRLAVNSVDTGNLIDGAVTKNKLAPLSVSDDKLADLAVTTSKLADASVTAAKIAPGAVSGAAIGNIDGSQINPGTVDGDYVLIAGSVSNVSLSSIDGSKIINNTVDGASKIIDGTVHNAELASDINGSKIVPNTLNADRIIDDSITYGKVGYGELTRVYYKEGTGNFNAGPNPNYVEIPDVPFTIAGRGGVYLVQFQAGWYCNGIYEDIDVRVDVEDSGHNVVRSSSMHLAQDADDVFAYYPYSHYLSPVTLSFPVELPAGTYHFRVYVRAIQGNTGYYTRMAQLLNNDVTGMRRLSVIEYPAGELIVNPSYTP